MLQKQEETLNPETRKMEMKILQQNLNHCEAAHDLLTQTVRDREIDLVIIADPYTRLNTQAWVTDATGITAIWSGKNRPFEVILQSSRHHTKRICKG